MAKVISKICEALTFIMTIVIILIVVALLGPKAMGYNTYAVLSGSMEPYYHVGSIVYVDKSVAPETLEVGDPVTFAKSDSMVVTHRIAEVHADKQEFITKGDANETIDAAPVSFSQVVGKAKWSIPLLGYLSIMMRTKQGMLMIGGVIIIFILLFLIPEILKPEGEKKEGK